MYTLDESGLRWAAVVASLPARENCKRVTRASTIMNPIGFIGLGLMGEPMALNLLRGDTPLVVWNRSPAKLALLGKAGARIAKDSQDVFQQCEVVILMLRDAEATDIVLGRQDVTFKARVDHHTIINMATTSPFYSESLEADIRAH